MTFRNAVSVATGSTDASARKTRASLSKRDLKNVRTRYRTSSSSSKDAAYCSCRCRLRRGETLQGNFFAATSARSGNNGSRPLAAHLAGEQPDFVYRHMEAGKPPRGGSRKSARGYRLASRAPDSRHRGSLQRRSVCVGAPMARKDDLKDTLARCDRVLSGALSILLATASACAASAFTAKTSDDLHVAPVVEKVVEYVQSKAQPVQISIQAPPGDGARAELLAEHRCL